MIDLLRRDDVSLVTLTGPGGVGKTRLALAVAHCLADHFTDEVIFVDLSPVQDHALVLPTIAAALGMQDTGGQGVAQMLVTALRGRHLVLVLDNCEQVVEAATDIATLLAACPSLKTLATSRVRLRVTAEHLSPIPPLQLPDAPALSSLDELAHSEAVAMFVARARAADPSFTLTDANSEIVASLVRRLDGLPLAIELAAARIRALSPEALMTRLEQRLPLLTGGARDAPVRQRTMRDAIAWSYDLLTRDEQALFQRLAIFVGGCTLEAVEVVVRGVKGDQPGIDILEGIASLVDKSLLRQETDPDGEPRYRMLETVREFGLEQLEASGEEASLRNAHAAWCLRLAETEQTGFVDPGPRSTAWMDRLEAELDNLRAAMAWGRETDNVEPSLRLGAALWQFWWTRGYVTEGGVWLEEMLACGGDASPAVRAAAVHAAGNLAHYRGDFEHAMAWHREDLTLRRELGDTRGAALALLCLGLEAFEQGDYDTAIPLLEESQPLFRQVGDQWGLALQRQIMAQIACLQDDYEQAAILCRESIALFREIGAVQEGAGATAMLGWIAECQSDVSQSSALYEKALIASRSVGDKATVAAITVSQAMLACREGDLDQATALLREALVLSGEVDSTRGIAAALLGLGLIACSQGDHRHSVTLFRESMVLSHRTSDKAAVVECLEGMAAALLGLGDAERAARLGGVTDAQRASMGMRLPPMGRAGHEHMKAGARGVLGNAAFAAAWAAGEALTLEQTVAEALAFEPSSSIEGQPKAAQNATALSKGLSPRELEVLRLLVEGNTDREIADALFVSRRTITSHTSNLFATLGVTNRVQAATVAIRKGLL